MPEQTSKLQIPAPEQTGGLPFQERCARFGVAALLLGALLVVIGWCHFLDFSKVVARIDDDAYYFFQVSNNVAKGNGPTFDGIHKTSGFQPLWMWTLVPIFRACPDDPETALRVGLDVQAVCLLAAALLIVLVMSRLFSWRAVLATIIFYVFLVYLRGVNGLESAVLVLALSALFAYGYYGRLFFFGVNSVMREFVFGLILGVVMLARLDLVFLGASIVAFRLWPALTTPAKRRESIAGAVAILAGASLVVSPYLAYNKFTFGHIMPISGGLKTSFPHVCIGTSLAHMLELFGPLKCLFIGSMALFACGYVVAYLLFLRRTATGGRLYFHTSVAVLACAVVLHSLNTILFMKWATMGWHFFPYLLFTALALAAPVERFLSVPPARRATAAYWSAVLGLTILICAATCYRSARARSVPRWQTASYKAALWAREHTAPSDVFALKDTGNFGYFSRRSVINLDGLVNNWQYQETLKNRELNRYFTDNHVKYLVLHSNRDRPDVMDGTYDSLTVTYRSNLYGTMSDPIVLKKSDEIYRDGYFHEAINDAFIVWKVFPTKTGP